MEGIDEQSRNVRLMLLWDLVYISGSGSLFFSRLLLASLLLSGAIKK
jgi:hypothetical protein